MNNCLFGKNEAQKKHGQAVQEPVGYLKVGPIYSPETPVLTN